MDLPDLFPANPMQLRTIRHYNFSEVSSAMQKAIRRSDARLAGYWALELWQSGFGKYVWKRLLTISAEDCWGILTQEVKALHDSYLVINDGIPPKQAKGRIFISKAVILLCLSKKSRDPDHLQNYVYDQTAGLDPDTLAQELRSSGEYVAIPEYAYDCHTREGKKRGKTKADFFRAEQAALAVVAGVMSVNLLTVTGFMFMYETVSKSPASQVRSLKNSGETSSSDESSDGTLGTGRTAAEVTSLSLEEMWLKFIPWKLFSGDGSKPVPVTGFSAIMFGPKSLLALLLGMITAYRAAFNSRPKTTVSTVAGNH